MEFRAVRELVPRLRARLAAESGQTVTEYSILLGFIALAVVAVLLMMGDQLGLPYQLAVAGFN
jgi:Flp pilus assembly pilin Flp